MARHNAIVRRLDAIEALGRIGDICCDKTGTLTTGKMVVRKYWNGEELLYFEGGDLSLSEVKVMTTKEGDNLFDFLPCISLCNNAVVFKAMGAWQAHGEATEVVLLSFSLTKGRLANMCHKAELYQVKSCCHTEGPRIGQGGRSLYPHARIPIQCGRQTHDNRISRHGQGETCRFYERGTGISNFSLYLRSIWKPSFRRAQKGNYERNGIIGRRRTGNILLDIVNCQRVLALARRELKRDGLDRLEAEKEMTFLGLIGLSDPPRAESAKAIESCRRAGITVHMLTGDHISTAVAIAKEVHILPTAYPVTSGLTAEKFDGMTKDEIDALPELPLVIARCSPQTKVRMVDAIHRRSRLTAMTGDGINDTPSIKSADVGIAMGLSGSNVARQAAEMVLADDNFATVVTAIQDGRRIFDNQMKFILYLMSSNCAEVIVLVAGLGFLDSTGQSVYPLSPVQVLWENLITSAFPAFAYSSPSIFVLIPASVSKWPLPIS
jgi:P-type Na+/K+ transporter